MVLGRRREDDIKARDQTLEAEPDEQAAFQIFFQLAPKVARLTGYASIGLLEMLN